MKRRSLLLGVGALASWRLAGAATDVPPDRLVVKIWLTDGAASQPASRDRAAVYVRRALEGVGAAATVSFGGTVPRSGGLTDRDLERRVWPRRVVSGALGASDLEPVDDVNLLLTDGDVHRPTAGFAYPHIAAVPGASLLAEAAPPDEEPTVVPYSTRTAVVQLLLHEVGHALGLGHRDGAVTVDDGSVIASPMVGGYAWAATPVKEAQLPVRTSSCGGPLQADLDGERRLSMVYSECAAQSLRDRPPGGPHAFLERS